MQNEPSRVRKLLLSTGTSLLNQFVVGISGLILPVYILQAFGSSVNGLVSSITKFLSLISLMDMGIGAVVQANLYKPLAEQDNKKLSEIVISAERFYRTLAKLFIVYVFILSIVYPLLQLEKYDYIFTASLVIIIAIGTFVQYYFGITYQTLLGADQKTYIYQVLQSIAVVLNLVGCIVLIKAGCSIHIVKLTTVIIYLIRPMGINLYVKKKYKIDKSVVVVGEPIRQKWNGFAQHIANVVLQNTSILVLTMFSTLENVSIYTVYYNVVRMIKELLEQTLNSLLPLLGSMYAKKENELLHKFFGVMEWGIHTIVVLLFSITGIMITPFVVVYTSEVNDVNYNQPLFGVLITLAIASYLLRTPYTAMVKAAGHFKQTQMSAIIEMVLNIVISVFSVMQFGLIGVTFGIIVSMTYRSLHLAIYTYKNILHCAYRRILMRWSTDCLTVFLIVISTKWISIEVTSYMSWFVIALCKGIISLGVVAVVNLLLCGNKVKQLTAFITKKERIGCE